MYFIRLNRKTVKLKTLPTMSELLKEFRNYKRILTEELKEFHSFAAIFQGVPISVVVNNFIINLTNQYRY